MAAEKEKEEEELKKAAEKDKKYKEWGQGYSILFLFVHCFVNGTDI